MIHTPGNGSSCGSNSNGSDGCEKPVPTAYVFKAGDPIGRVGDEF